MTAVNHKQFGPTSTPSKDHQHQQRQQRRCSEVRPGTTQQPQNQTSQLQKHGPKPNWTTYCNGHDNMAGTPQGNGGVQQSDHNGTIQQLLAQRGDRVVLGGPRQKQLHGRSNRIISATCTIVAECTNGCGWHIFSRMCQFESAGSNLVQNAVRIFSFHLEYFACLAAMPFHVSS